VHVRKDIGSDTRLGDGDRDDVVRAEQEGRRTRSRCLSSWNRRLVYSIALVPIVPASAFCLSAVLTEYVPVPTFDEVRWFNLMYALLSLGGTIAIWRPLVVWTSGRTGLTAAVSVIPFVQVIYAQPLWNAGCVGDDILELGQASIGIGVWIWLLMWVWWGWEKAHMAEQVDRGWTVNRRVPRHVRKVVSSLSVVPVTVGLFFICGAALDSLAKWRDSYVWMGTYTATSLLAVASWLLIWRVELGASGRVRLMTLLAAAGMLLVPSLMVLLAFGAPSALQAALQVLPIIGWGAWMAWTVWYWPGSGSDVAGVPAGPKCLKCGYLLNGLYATRCPECGDEPTLDELWRATMSEVT